MVYVRSGPKTIIVQHTDVLEAGKGKGLGRALFQFMVGWARENGNKVTPQCPFTRKMFGENPEARDVLR
jgi:predicted GNAT family acetyltransferase